MFLAGLLLSMPIMAALLIINMALGIMTRAAPQLNVFSVGFPITLAAGFVVLAIALPYFVPVFDRLIHDAVQMTMKSCVRQIPAAP